MTTRYLELRGRVHRDATNVMADVMRHLHARQHLGKAMVVGDDPALQLALAHKQWLKLSRLLQRRRALATNPVEILKLTYTITQMQHVKLTTATPVEQPEASVYVLQPPKLGLLPMNCLSLYLTAELPAPSLARLVLELPAAALVVDYAGQLRPADFGLRPKAELEAEVAMAWRGAAGFLEQQRIDAHRLATAPNSTELMDDALDVLLGVEEDFLELAGRFQRALDLARPLRTISKQQRDQYEVFIMLAHRVRTLAPGGFSAQFLNTYADDTFFLNDHRELEALAQVVARQQLAGRFNLVRALLRHMPMRRELFACL